ncbi:MAG: glutamate--tRNA ligase [Candidatus Omnitrophica bacterium]|nr:glutamate--tRNA ligase [Candidatus Omnitrophota bacterium]MDD5671382.1 glutamate--tRNA ligase [Candidatus Omnitrophota bacterium]
MIRTRFAPSPTGFLHIGGVRTALFSFLYARRQQGEFLLRIEDTDRERSKPEFEKDILNALQWLGLRWDHDVLYQSRRLGHYLELARDLVGRGLAYEEVNEGRTAVKFRMPKTEIVFQDAVREEVRFDTALFDDLVIIKSDGFPTFMFACAVDDHDMEITHVIRGEDHLSNTPRQILLFQAFGWKPPQYAHLPLILGSDGTPLSKRHGAVALTAYREESFLPEALLNYLALLGWSGESNQELYRLEELVKKFSLKRITKSGARFDREKLEWVNMQHIKNLAEPDYLAKMTAALENESKQFDPEVWKRLVLLYRPRIKTFKDLLNQANYCFNEIGPYDREQINRFFTDERLKSCLEKWAENAKGLPSFGDIAQLEAMTRNVADDQKVEAKILIHPLRFALTGLTASPGLFDLMSVLGKEVCLKRVGQFLESAPAK